MARTKRSRRSYGAGEWGRNRVRIFPDPKTGMFQIEWRENGRRLTRSLKHRDWRRAKRQADEFAAGFAGPGIGGEAEAKPEPLTLEKLFDIYGEEVTPTKGVHTRGHDRAAMRMFLRFFGPSRDPATLSQRTGDSRNPGRKSSKVIQDCTICVSCRWCGPCWIVPRKREKAVRLAGVVRPICAHCGTSV